MSTCSRSSRLPRVAASRSSKTPLKPSVRCIAATPAGTLGTIGCFSLQQGKHITCGEGGIVVTDDDAIARRMFLFINKAWGYGDPQPDHYFLALNYRLSELQGAVALAQIGKLDATSRRDGAPLAH